MPDMLVKLYDIHQYDDATQNLFKHNIIIKQALSPNLTQIREWITKNFDQNWADEATKSILVNPSACFLAVKDNELCGFACYDSVAKGFFGPTGVIDKVRGQSVGKALLVHTLKAMYTQGYQYAIIGGVGPADFYTKCCGASIIPESTPSVYKNLI